MLVDVTPTAVVVPAGESATFLVTVVNTEPIISAHRVTVLGVDPAWVTVDHDQLSLFPDSSGVVTLTVQLPPGIPAGLRRVAVQVREVTAPGAVEVVEVEVDVPAAHGTRIELEPASFTGGGRATVGIVLANDGNADTDVSLSGTDADKALGFEFEPPAMRLAAGERATAVARVRSRRPLTGSPRIRQLTVVASPDGAEPVAAIGTFVQKPLLSRGALGLLGLLAAVSVFAAVIATTFGQVVGKSQDDRDLVLDALRSGADGGDGGQGAGGLAGTVTLLTDGTAVAGVTVEIYDAADVVTPLANAATGDDGTYSFDGLDAGSYKLRYRGAGFSELWWPQAVDSGDAQEIELAAGEVRQGVDIRLGGVPGSIAGTVIGTDPAGATVSIRLPVDAAAAIDPLSAPIVATAVVDGTGAFLVPGLPSPSVYEVLVQKEGFASEIQLVNLSAGEARTGLEITLRRGDGAITGSVFDDDGPLGGATVAASDGTTTIRTVTLTRDAVGTFTLRALPTPATYTIVISAPGHVTETVSVSLGVREERDGIEATLRSDAGSIAGRVQVAGGGPAGGVKVRATDGETTVETVTLSSGDVGSYLLVGLPVPGTYTLTFERDDLTPQTRAIDLDALGTPDVTGVDANLVPATATLSGTVFDDEDEPLGEVQVVLTSGDRSFTTVSASAPTAGAYEIDGLPPGTYSVSFQRAGSVPTTLLVTLAAGEEHSLDAHLTPRASIRGTVLASIGDEQPTPLAGAQVRLFVASSFPGDPVLVVLTGADGTFSLDDLTAPESYVVDFAVAAGEPPQQSRSLVLGPGEAFALPDPVVLEQ